MQELAFETVLFAETFVEGEVAMLIVHDHGIAEPGEVKPDLMLATRFDPHSRQGRIGKSFFDFEPCDRPRRCAVASRQRQIDGAFVLRQPPREQAKIDLFYLARLK